MDKIIALLKQAGVNEDLCKSITGALVEFKETEKKALNEAFLKKVDAAKKVCLEESEKHKQDLARRTQIWCESHAARVERKLTQQSAMKESAAATKLEQLKALLEGVELNGRTNSALQSEVKKLQGQISSISEDRKRLSTVVKRQTTLAENALKRNRQLEGKVQTLTESKVTAPTQTVRQMAALPQRNQGQPVTTRRTLNESQTRVAPERRRVEQGSDWSVDSIARQID